MPKTLQELIAIGSAIKAMPNGKISGHLVLFGDANHKDLDKQYFSAKTYFGPGDGDNRDTTFHHMIPFKTGNREIDQQLYELAKTPLPAMKTRRDALGIIAEVTLNLSDEYQKLIYDLSAKGALKWSAGSAPHMVVVEDDGFIKQFPIIEGALTPIPAEPRMLDHRVMPIKSFLDLFKTPDVQSGGIGDAQTGAHASRKAEGKSNGLVINQQQHTKGVKTMDILEAIKQLIPGLSEEQVTQLAAILGLSGMTVYGGETAPDGVEAGKSMKMANLLSQLRSAGYELALPGQKSTKAASVRPSFASNPNPITEAQPAADEDPEKVAATKSLNAIYTTRYGKQEDAERQIISDVIGPDYQEVLHGQEVAFQKFVKRGERVLTGQEYGYLQRQIYPIKHIVKMAQGMDLKAIKTTMVEAQGELGGFAVPAMVQDRIITRLPGMTATRAAGAEIVTLERSNGVELMVWDGGTDQYTGNIRGEWGDETADPNAKNAKMKLIMTNANVYTYKVEMSQSLVEDAVNVVNKVENDIVEVLGMDEDGVFLTGDGVGKPLGLLPGSTNVHSFTEVVSGAAAALTAAGIKALKRGIASQYRKNGVWVGNSSTFGDIDSLVATDGKFIFEDLSETEKLLAKKVFESEFMADVAAAAYPLLFGDMSGYTIVERLGLSIERFHDSGTGINKVQFQVRRRIGGRPTQPWKFAVQKVAAS